MIDPILPHYIDDQDELKKITNAIAPLMRPESQRLIDDLSDGTPVIVRDGKRPHDAALDLATQLVVSIGGIENSISITPADNYEYSYVTLEAVQTALMVRDGVDVDGDGSTFAARYDSERLLAQHEREIVELSSVMCNQYALCVFDAVVDAPRTEQQIREYAAMIMDIPASVVEKTVGRLVRADVLRERDDGRFDLGARAGVAHNVVDAAASSSLSRAVKQ